MKARQSQTVSTAAVTSSFTPVHSGVLQRKCDCGNHTIAGTECSPCSKEHESTLQRSAVVHESARHHDGHVPPIVHEVLRSPGQPLDAAARAFFELRFGYDFSRVRVHADDRAQESAHSVSALAYTVGTNIVFGAGQYMPYSASGRRLIAHELAHVLQQSGSNEPASLTSPAKMTTPHDSSELEAEHTAAAISSGNEVQVSNRGTNPTLARVDIPLWDCPRRIAPMALAAAQASGLPGLHNGPADAYRHCFWSCEMVKQCSWLAAYTAGTGHELTDWTANESDMDLNNNAAGRDCGSESATCDACCRAKLAAGRLTVMGTGAPGSGYYSGGNMGYRGISDTPRPNDPRRY